jgi:hypothetical protein
MNSNIHPSLFSFSTSDSAGNWVSNQLEAPRVPPICRPVNGSVESLLRLSEYPPELIIALLRKHGIHLKHSQANSLPENQAASSGSETVASHCPVELQSKAISQENCQTPSSKKIASTLIIKRLPVKKKASGAKHKVGKCPPIQESFGGSSSLCNSSIGSFSGPKNCFSNSECLLAAASLHSFSRAHPTPNGGTESQRIQPPPNKKRKASSCNIENCQNTVVQGGVCLQHGAKRKSCKHPGCTKNVKQAGMCSAHGPARKSCATEWCRSIAVQGGVCIAHGAKQQLCSVAGCTKKSKKAFAYMCKLHHDML